MEPVFYLDGHRDGNGRPTSAALLGIGVIILGAQAARKYFQMSLEKFWIIVGLLFFCGGLWDMFELSAPFGAFIFIAIGALILFSAFRNEKPEKQALETPPAEDVSEGEDSVTPQQ